MVKEGSAHAAATHAGGEVGWVKKGRSITAKEKPQEGEVISQPSAQSSRERI
jgi:hypothetical protein